MPGFSWEYFGSEIERIEVSESLPLDEHNPDGKCIVSIRVTALGPVARALAESFSAFADLYQAHALRRWEARETQDRHSRSQGHRYTRKLWSKRV